MACLSCQVEHTGSSIGCVVEQRLHLWCKVLDSADTATLCSQVESITSILKKENALGTLRLEARCKVHNQMCIHTNVRIYNSVHYSTVDGMGKMSHTYVPTQFIDYMQNDIQHWQLDRDTDSSHLDWQCETSNTLTLITSVNEQLYLCTSRSTTPVWPLPAASITGVAPCCRKRIKRQGPIVKVHR